MSKEQAEAVSQEQTHIRIALTRDIFGEGFTTKAGTLLIFAKLPKGVPASHVMTAINRGHIAVYGAREEGAVSPVTELTPPKLHENKGGEHGTGVRRNVKFPIKITEPIGRMKKSELQVLAGILGLSIKGKVEVIRDRIDDYLDESEDELVIMVDSLTDEDEDLLHETDALDEDENDNEDDPEE